jgi:hypothetical protein
MTGTVHPTLKNLRTVALAAALAITVFGFFGTGQHVRANGRNNSGTGRNTTVCRGQAPFTFVRVGGELVWVSNFCE